MKIGWKVRGSSAKASCLGHLRRKGTTVVFSLKAKVIFVSLLFVLGFPTVGFSKSDFYQTYFDSFSKILSSHSSEASNKKHHNNCSKEYLKLYRENTLRVSMFFGVLDMPNGDLLDRPAKDAVVKHLKKECIPDYYACGFKQKSSEPNVLQKFAVDSNIIISIYDSSVSESAEEITSNMRSEQEERSQRVTDHFLGSIESDSVVFYVGHSRFGTGPGFYCLPPLSSQWLLTYIHSPLLSAMLHKLKKTASPPEVFGLFSCSSKRYYAKKIHSAAPEMALVVSDGMTLYESDIVGTVDVLNSIVGNICYAKPGGTAIIDTPNPDFRLYGFFSSNKFPNFKSNASLFGMSTYIFILPLLILILSKFYSVHAKTRLHIQTYFKDLVLVNVLPILCFFVSYTILKPNHDFGRYSIPSFIILCGLLLLLRFYLQQKDVFLVVIKTFQVSIAPLFFSICILFFPGLIAEPNLNQLTLSIVKAIQFVALFLAFLPFVIFSTEILMYPLWNDTKVHIAIRTFVFAATAMCLYTMVTFLSIYLNSNIMPYRGAMLLFFVYIQSMSLLLYYYKKSPSLPIMFQTLTLALIFSENIHCLFY